MRVLVTGGTGQLGGALVTVLGPVVCVIAPARNELDLAEPQRIASVLNHLHPELIINAGAYTGVDRAEDEAELCFRVNAEAPAAIALWAADRKVPMIHFSTDYVFDGKGTRPWQENDKPNPLSVYGASKRAGDDAVHAAGGVHLIIRTSWVYAAQGVNFLRTIFQLAKERDELRIVGDQIGAPTSARLIADTVARIIGGDGGVDSALLPARFSPAEGLVNVAASGETSWYGFARAIVEGLKKRGVALAVKNILPIATKDYPTKARRPANCRLDLSRLKLVFNIDPPQWDKELATELDRLPST